MRTSRIFVALAATLATAAACGRSNDSPDARQTADASQTPDAPNGTPDAPNPDSNTGPSTRVWIDGDFATNGTRQIGTFIHEGSTPPLTLTGLPAQGELYNLNFPVPLAVSADGTKIAYTADSTTATQFDLFLADADGSNPVSVTTANNGSVIMSIAFSPDGTKLAFVSDRDVATQFDVYLVAAAASSTPVRVSPQRNNVALDAGGPIAWSADSKYIAFSGDLTTDTLFGLWTVDTTAGTPAAVNVVTDADIMAAATPKGVLAPGPKFTAGGKVVFYGHLAVGTDSHIYVSTPDVAGVAQLASTQMNRTTGGQPAEAHAFGLSPDGMKIVFSADGETTGAFDLYVANSDGTGTATKLTTGTTRVGGDLNGFEDVVFSPDASKVAVVADWGVTDAKFELYVVPVAGGGATRVVVPGGATDAERDVQKPQWTLGGAALYYIADGGVMNNDFGLYVADPAGVDQAGTLVISPPTSGDVFGVITRY